MPEGDTIYRTAVALRKAIDGRVVTEGPERLRGQTVAVVQPRGKHILIWFEPSGLALHTHMRMSGSWHLYRPGEVWRKPRRHATVMLGTDEWVAVCFSAPVCAILTEGQVDRHPALGGLGPDALADVTDLAEARRRLESRPDIDVGEAILDQRVLAGVGNVYRCESLFLARINPWTRVGDMTGEQREELLATAERLLKANTGTVRRTTITGAGASLAVYGRAGRPCPRCREPIRVARQGAHARVVYWCGFCQASLDGDSR